jgi:hypothetical protein
MALKERINTDLKTALLGGDKFLAEVLRGIKSVILNEEIAKNVRENGLKDAEIEQLLQKEAKKRVESAELFARGGNMESSEKELREKAVLEQYLPQQISDEDLKAAVDQAIADAGEGAQMGQIIGAVKAKVGNTADGGRIAAEVKKHLT